MFSKELLLKQEEVAVLKRFDMDDAFMLAQRVLELAGDDASKISVSIYKGIREVFFLAGNETTYENEYWIHRKRNVVNHHEHSSMLVRLNYDGDEEKYYRLNALKPSEYAIHGGGFPIRVEGTGFVGVVTISGLAMEDDHMLCVNALNMLKSEQEEFVSI